MPRRVSRHWTRAALAALLVTALARPAAGQPAPQPGAPQGAGDRAVEAGQRGLAAFQEGKWMEAHARFAEANALSASPVFVLYMARSLRNAGRLIDARTRYRELTATPIAETAPSTWQHAQVDGRGELAALERAIPSIVIELRNPPVGVALTVDDQPAAALRPIELDPGPHRVVARAGATVKESVATLTEGMSATPVVIDFAPQPPPGPGPFAGPGGADRALPTAPPEISRRSGLVVELDVAAALTPSMGGVVSDSGGIGAGAMAVLHGGYRLAAGPSFGLAVGGLFLSQSRQDRPFSLVPRGEQPDRGTLDHDLSIRGGLLGATAAARFGGRTSAELRLLAGVALTSVKDSRRGTFESEAGSTYDTPELSHSSTATFFAVAPELRAAHRLAEHLEISAGVSLMMLLSLGRARWEDDQLVSTGSAAASFPDEDLTAGVIAVIAPGVGLRYDF